MAFLGLFFRGEICFIKSSTFSRHAAEVELGTDSAKEISHKTSHKEKQSIKSLETIHAKFKRKKILSLFYISKKNIIWI